jgi:hypothetical protein
MKLPVAARAAFVVVASCGCAHPLLEESGEPLTRIVISNAGVLPLRATVYQDDLACGGARAAPFKGGVAVVDMPAKPWATVAFDYTRGHGRTPDTCAGIGSFRADAAHEYHVDIAEADGACGMRVTARARDSRDALTPVDLKPRRALPLPADATSPRCKPDQRFVSEPVTTASSQ